MKHTLLIMFALSACAPSANVPSLLPRPIETRGEAEAMPPAPPLKAIDAALAQKLTARLADARAGDVEFSRIDAASPNLRAGLVAAQGSEAWVAAQQARSALDAARQASSGALAEIDALSVANAADAANDAATGGAAEIAAAKAVVETIVARQTARLEAIGP